MIKMALKEAFEEKAKVLTPDLSLHPKGGKYWFIQTAFDSETQERMVIYQALYGEQRFWVRHEKIIDNCL